MDRCGLLWRPRERAWEVRLARARSDIANLFVGAAVCARVGARLPGDAAARFRWHARRRWLPRLALPRSCVLEATLAARRGEFASRRDVFRLAASECGRDSGWFRCRCGPSCLRRARRLLF